ncbi:uncharacterized protein [Nicotiana tomentosiformis]|uniref:uncharacterized protein n=1 Tax=Nicotiana tomentosiformis TaxID=4098 RepID=UPI00388C5567
MAVDLDVEELIIMGDSDWIIRQAQGEWETRDIKLIPYRQHGNVLVDPLEIQIRERHGYCNTIEIEPDVQLWYIDIKRFMKIKKYPEQASGDQKRTIRRLASSFFLSGEMLYKRNPDLNLLRTVISVRYTVTGFIPRLQSCILCQYLGHSLPGVWMSLGQSSRKLQMGTDSSWLPLIISQSGLKQSPSKPSPRKRWWTSCIPTLFCHFGIPKTIITDNAANLNNHLMREVCEQFKITHRNSTLYRPKANGVVEAANKNIKKIFKKMIQSSRQWHEKLPFALLGYCTTMSTSVWATPYLLVYGTEAVIPAKDEIPSLRIIVEAEIEDDEWIKARLEKLTMIDEKRMAAVCYGQLYQQRMARSYNKKVRPRKFEVGQLVLRH